MSVPYNMQYPGYPAMYAVPPAGNVGGSAAPIYMLATQPVPQQNANDQKVPPPPSYSSVRKS